MFDSLPSPDALRQLPQNDRLMRLHFPHNDGPNAVLLIDQMTANEELSKSFSFHLDLLSDDAYLEMKEFMGVMMTVELEQADGSARYFNGYVTDAARLGSNGGYCSYRVTLSPWLDLLRNRVDNFIYQDQNLLQTIDSIFGDYQPYSDYRTQVYDSVPTETFRVQGGRVHPHDPHGETDYNYLHRRLEEKGWYYWYEHRQDGHTLVISDNSVYAAEPIDGSGRVRFHGDPATMPEDTLQHWDTQRLLSPSKVSLTSFDFKHPQVAQANTETRNEQGSVLRTEVYEYSGAYGFRDLDAGEQQATLRMEEHESAAKVFEGRGNCRFLQPGRTFELRDHFVHDQDDSLDRQFLVRRICHIASNNYLQGNATGPVYTNQFTAQRKTIPYRPGRNHNSSQPRMYGIQSAIVVGPPGEEIYCDEYGRVRVQFHWDREGQHDEKSSCWVRVSTTWAGSNFGAIAVPRVNQEVLVQWIDGNPDLPIITGRVYNQANMPPWDLPGNKTQSGILSRSTKGGQYSHANALRFEDKKGEEEVWLHAEKDQRIEVEHDESHWVGHDRTKTIDHDETVLVKHDRTETVNNNETITVHNNRLERVDHNETISIGDNRAEDVGKNETISIGQNRSETVGQNETVHIGDNRSVTIGGSKSETVGKAKTETIALAKMLTIGGLYQTTVGGAMNTSVVLMQTEQVGLSKDVKVGKTLSISAGDRIELICGDSKITLLPKSVHIESPDIHLKAANHVHVDGPKDVMLNSGTAQAAPKNGDKDNSAGGGAQ